MDAITRSNEIISAISKPPVGPAMNEEHDTGDNADVDVHTSVPESSASTPVDLFSRGIHHHPDNAREAGEAGDQRIVSQNSPRTAVSCVYRRSPRSQTADDRGCQKPPTPERRGMSDL
jgi:hypothetical protein